MLQSIEQQFVRTSRPLYAPPGRRCSKAPSPAASCRPGRGCRPSASWRARLRISRTTVVSAYRELESRGLLRGYVGRGTFVCAAPEPTGAPFAWRGKIAAAALRSSDSTLRDAMRHSSDARLLSLAAGEPAIDCFPTAAFRARDRSRPDARRRRGLAARPDRGAAGAARRRSPSASACPPTACWCISGAQQGLDLLARCLIDPGDAVIVDRPGYLGAIQSFRAAGAKLIGWDIAQGGQSTSSRICSSATGRS